jgi:hypothetical protein
MWSELVCLLIGVYLAQEYKLPRLSLAAKSAVQWVVEQTKKPDSPGAPDDAAATATAAATPPLDTTTASAPNDTSVGDALQHWLTRLLQRP